MINFAKCFEILTENSPFAWQIRLYEKFLTNQIPSACDIPTGLGKTSVIVIWLLALTTKLLENPQENNIPRRLVYVVDRRVIVDQATDEAQKILCRLKELKDSEDEDLRKIFSVLQKSSFLVESQNDVTSSERENANVIALSTLRGEYADNREWCLDPSRPAIIVGTIDMIGSRLLFSAYGGVGESYKALQAGLLGQDTLVVIDEAHLSPAFMQTLRAIHPFVNRKDKNTIKPFNIMSLSATLEKEDGDKPSETFVLEKDAPEDLTNEVAALRLNAEKKIEWKSFQVGEDVLKSKKAQQQLREIQAKEMASVAAQYKDLPVSVLVFGKTVDLVKKIKDELIASQDIDKNQVLLMVGGMRGYERDQLVGNPVFQMFAPKPNRPQQDKSYFLVATSCAEVGVNLDADFAVCDLTSADSFIQRLGRVNRFGESSSVVTIVFNDDLSLQTEQAIETLKTLRQSENGNSLNASPLALRQIKFDESLCYPPKPVCPPLDSARIDDWSMTSLKQNEFPRSLVSYWLRGVTKNTVPETSLCWRAYLSLASTDRRKIVTVKTVRVKSRECARESTHRAEATIKAIAEKFPEHRAVVITSDGDYKVRSLGELNDNPDLYAELMFATVVLPCEAGGLENGIAVEVLPKDTAPVTDVVDADEWIRVVLTETEEATTAKIINGESKTYDGRKIEEAIRHITQSENKRCVKQIVISSAAESEEEKDAEKPKKQVLAYFINRKSPDRFLPSEGEMDDETASLAFGQIEREQIELEKHNADVSNFARRLAAKLFLSAEFSEALEIAGSWHDKGKARECWQKAVGNFAFPEKILAKSNQTWFNHKLNDYYRHEFGSLIEAEESEELNEHPNRDLILHLIATHHGYARPHFPARAFDKDNPTRLNQETAERAMRRFADLQTKYGWWQLAYLEAVLKAADALASRAEARGEI